MIILLVSYTTTKTPPHYSLVKNEEYPMSMVTKEEYGIEFYVKSSVWFTRKYPAGSLERADIDSAIVTYYKDTLKTYCRYEQKFFTIHRADFPIPFCSKLKSMAAKHT